MKSKVLIIIIVLAVLFGAFRDDLSQMLDKNLRNGRQWKQPAIKTMPAGKSVENAYDKGLSQKLK